MNDINAKITETIVPAEISETVIPATITENIIHARIDNYGNPGVPGPKGEKGDPGEPGIGVTAEDVGFTITAGITPKTLTVALDASVSGTNTGDQAIPDKLSDLSDDTTHRLVTDAEKSTWNAKQEALVSGTNIKTINSNSILGSGDLVLSSSDEKVKYDVNDTTAGYIADKIIAGTGISVAEGSGANENKLVVTNNNPTPYTLPTASTTVLGGVKVDGTTISITDGIISGSSTYSLPTASTTVLGGVKIDGTTITIADGIISGASSYESVFEITSLAELKTVLEDTTKSTKYIYINPTASWDDLTATSIAVYGMNRVYGDWIMNPNSGSPFTLALTGGTIYVMDSLQHSGTITLSNSFLLVNRLVSDGTLTITPSGYGSLKYTKFAGGTLAGTATLEQWFTGSDDIIISSDNSVNNIIALTKAEYDALSSGEKAGNTYITTDEPDASIIVENVLTSTSTVNALSANQGKVLNDKFSETVLYNDATGTNGTVTLSETSATFSYLEIYYKDDNDIYSSIKVFSPNGKWVSLLVMQYSASSITFRGKNMQISGTNITNGGYIAWVGQSNSIYNNNNIYVTRVVGYR